MNNSLISKTDFPQCLLFSKIIHLLKSYLLIRCCKIYKIRFFLLYTSNTDKNGVNKQKTHTHQTLFFSKKTVFYQHLPFYGKNRKPPPPLPSFFENFENSLKGGRGGGGGVWGASYVLEKQSSGKLMDFMID